MKTDIDSELFKTDAEFMQTFRSFSDEEVPAYVNGKDGNPVKVAEKERNLAVLAALLGVQGKEEFEAALDKALAGGSVTPVEAKEVVYQATAYLGFGKVRPFLEAANKVMKARRIKLPLEGQKTVNDKADGENSRLRAGTKTPFSSAKVPGDSDANFYAHYPYNIEQNYFNDSVLETRPGYYRQKTVEVGSFKPNGNGLYDIHGNVSEWC